MLNECIPFKEAGTTFTARTTADVVGKRFVKISGDRTGGGGGGAEGAVTVGVGLSTDVENVYRVAQCGAKDACVGVSGWDAKKDLEVKVFAARKGIIVPVTGGEALTAGWEVEADAEGKAIKYAAGIKLGMVMTKTSGADKDAEILLY